MPTSLCVEGLVPAYAAVEGGRISKSKQLVEECCYWRQKLALAPQVCPPLSLRPSHNDVGRGLYCAPPCVLIMSPEQQSQLMIMDWNL